MPRHDANDDGAREWALVVRLGGIGDNLIASSILPLLAQDYRVEVMAQEPWHEVFINHPFIDKLTVKKREDFPQSGGLEWQQWFDARSREYARTIHLSHSCETMLALVPAQTQFYWPAAWRREWCGISYLDMVHDIAGVPRHFADGGGPRFYMTDAEWERAAAVKASFGPKVVGVCLSGSRLDKTWPYTPMLVNRIIRELDIPVILFGAAGRENEMAKSIMESVELWSGKAALKRLGAAISPDGDKPSWPLRRSLATLQQMDVVVGPDTGPMWSVAMEDMPKAMLLSHASQTNITKHWINTETFHADPARVDCWPCHRLHSDMTFCRKAPDDIPSVACMADIDHAAVFDYVVRSLATCPAVTPALPRELDPDGGPPWRSVPRMVPAEEDLWR